MNNVGLTQARPNYIHASKFHSGRKVRTNNLILHAQFAVEHRYKLLNTCHDVKLINCYSLLHTAL